MQPDNDQLDVFLSDPTFRHWVRQGGMQQPDAPWSRWLQDNPAQQPTAEQARMILLAAHLPNETVAPEQTERFIEQVLAHTQGQQSRPLLNRLRWLIPTWLSVAAAMIVLTIGLGWLLNRSDPVRPVTYQALLNLVPASQETQNTTDKPMLVRLADGTTVLLQPNARLSYPPSFTAANREVVLAGDAFFNVAHNPQQPFLVLANGMITKVLGTSFRIRANDADSIVTVEVKTGRVAVFAQADLNRARQSSGLSARSMLVTPNQQVVFLRQNEQMSQHLVAEPALLKSPEQNRDFSFTETPISQVFATLETAYGVDIVYDADALQRCSLTAPLGNEPLFDKLTIICRAIGGRYEVVGAQIVVQSDGCTD